LHESNSSATTAISVSDSDAKTVNLKTNHRAGRGGEPLDFSPLFQIDKGFSVNPTDSAFGQERRDCRCGFAKGHV
jgi:hypothetical protein